MRSRIITTFIVLTMTLALAGTTQAQRAGFIAGLAPTPPAASPVQPFITAPVQPFITAPVQPFGRFGTTPPITLPIITTTYSPIYSNFPAPAVVVAGPQIVYPSGFYAGNGVTIIAPATVLATSPVVIQQRQGHFAGGMPFGMRTAPPDPGVHPPSAGATRADVIQQLGTPVTSVMTQHGETMYFNGGVTVILQDGKVVNPQRAN